MKRLLLIALACLGFAPETFAGKNAIYRGSITLTDFAGAKPYTTSAYLIFGEETPVEGTSQDHTRLTGRFIYLNGVLGRKRYAIAPVDPGYRSVEFTKTIRNKTTITEVITMAQGHPTNSEQRFFSLGAVLLAGTHSSPKYRFPMTLKGQLLQSSASYGLSNELTATAQRATLQLRLVTSLTDPIPDNETLEDSTKRVADHLQSIGFIEYAVP